eukprot:655881-Prymnesium_polylepis.1
MSLQQPATPVVLSVAECLTHTRAAGWHMCAPTHTSMMHTPLILTHRPPARGYVPVCPDGAPCLPA